MKTSTSDRLRIAMVVHDYNRHAGHSRYVAELASRFKHEHEVHIFANTFEEADPTDLKFHKIPAVRRPQLAKVLSFILPGTFLVRGKFDVIHAQGLCGLRHDVATMHFCTPAWYDALEAGGQSTDWKGRLFRTLVTPWERVALTAKRTRRVIAISGKVRENLATYYGRRDGVDVIYHGVDTETFHPSHRQRFRAGVRAELGIPESACVALFVGPTFKGADPAIRATARVPGLLLVFVTASHCDAEKALAAAERVADRVRFLGHSKQVQRFFAASDIFLFPTIYETFGMVISEAMAAGLPVVTSRSAGAAELITHGVDGWVVDPPWDLDGLTAGLRTLVADPAAREAMGQAARRTIEAYTWDRAAAETLAVYRQIAGR